MPSAPSSAGPKGLGFTNSRRIALAKAREITTVEDFIEGYRSREDVSLLKPGTLIPGSHDVLVNRAGWVETRMGYIMDGPMSSVTSPVRASFSWKTGQGIWQLLRASLLTSAGNDGQLQLRWVDTAGVLGAPNTTYWLPLLTGLTSTYFQFSNYWDVTALKAELLMVNRTAYFWEWSGALGTVASVAATTITLAGTKTLAQLGFDSSGYVINNGIVYQYDSISNQTFTLNNAAPSPVGAVVGSPAYEQPVQSTAFSNMTFTNTPSPATYFTLDLLAVLSTNQVVVGSIASNQVYLSKAGTYVDYSQSTARIQYEGDMLTAVSSLTAIIPQESTVYVSAGTDEWYELLFADTTITDSTTGATFTFENTNLGQLKTAALQAAQGPYSTTKIANDVVFLSFEPIVSSIGRVANILTTPQVSDLSFRVQNDIDAYNTTDAWMAYNKKRLYVGFPQMGLFRVYNMTNPKAPFWEAPQNISLSGISFQGTTVIGHSYQTSESYVMYTGYSDRAPSATQAGNPISWAMVFAFQNSGLRATRKSMNKFFIEGYMNSNTSASIGLTYRSPDPGILPSQTIAISGSAKYVLQSQSLVSLGKSSLGKNPLGGDIQYPSQFNLPPYFAVIFTFTRKPNLSFSPTFSGTGLNQVFKLLSFGSNGSPATETASEITI